MGGSLSNDRASSPSVPAAAPGAAVTTARRAGEDKPLLPVQQERKRVLGLVAMSAIIWFNVSGGPSGSEEIIAAAGPIAGLGLMLVFVVFYSIPQALMTAELSTAFADNGGYSLWVKAAFGDFWAVQESLWSFASGVADSALYPVLFYHVCQKLVRWAVGYGSGLEQTSCTISLFQGSRFGLLGHHRNPMLCAATDWMCAAEWGCKVLILFVFAAPNLLLVSSKLAGAYLVSLATFVVRRKAPPATEPPYIQQPAASGLTFYSPRPGRRWRHSSSCSPGARGRCGGTFWSSLPRRMPIGSSWWGCSIGRRRALTRPRPSQAPLLPLAHCCHCPHSSLPLLSRRGGVARAHVAPCAGAVRLLGGGVHGAATARGGGQRQVLEVLGGGLHQRSHGTAVWTVARRLGGALVRCTLHGAESLHS